MFNPLKPFEMMRKGKTRCIRSIRSVADMDTLALSIGGGQFASIWYRSNFATMNAKLIGGKKNPLHGRLQALTCKTSMQIADDYEKVMRKRTGNPDFKADHLKWGHWMVGAYKRIIEHKGNHYLRAYPSDNTLRKVLYVLDGALVVNPDLKKYIEDNIRNEEAVVNDFRYDNIVCVKAMKTTFNVSL